MAKTPPVGFTLDLCFLKGAPYTRRNTAFRALTRCPISYVSFRLLSVWYHFSDFSSRFPPLPAHVLLRMMLTIEHVDRRELNVAPLPLDPVSPFALLTVFWLSSFAAPAKVTADISAKIVGLSSLIRRKAAEASAGRRRQPLKKEAALRRSPVAHGSKA